MEVFLLKNKTKTTLIKFHQYFKVILKKFLNIRDQMRTILTNLDLSMEVN